MKITRFTRHVARTALLPVLVAFLFILFPDGASAAPYHGERTFTYTQPNGESFKVRLWGD